MTVKEKDMQLTAVESEGKEKIPYPKSVFFIIGNEFCERFSYYGMKAILTIYLINALQYDPDKATSVYHIFSMGCYFTPVFGAMLADSFLGKFRTIFYISIVYAIGNFVLAVGAVPQVRMHEWVPMIGLTLIALGTGGIKPCVAAFGGDQFVVGQEKQLERFFSLFYMAINAGSLLSTFLTPILRSQVHCLGDVTCFPLAFGVPAVLMVVALVLFIIGKPLYRITPPSGNIVIKVIQCSAHAISNKFKSKERKEHWLDHAADKFDKDLISDIKDVFHVLVLYLPIPIFWALFDQQGSRWTIQASNMDGEVGSYQFQPDQMQLANPFLILILVPTCSYIVYPMFAKCNLLKRPLQRIVAGGLLAAAAFVLAAFIELKLEAGSPGSIESGFGRLSIMNTAPCPVTVNNTAFQNVTIPTGKFNASNSVEAGLQSFEIYAPDPKCPLSGKAVTYSFNLTSEDVKALVVGVDPRTDSLSVNLINDTFTKFENLTASFKIVYNSEEYLPLDAYFSIKMKNSDLDFRLKNTQNDSFLGSTELKSIDPGKYEVRFPYQYWNGQCPDFEMKNGGIYTLLIRKNKNETICNLITSLPPNTLTMFLQIPQYFVITMGEVMFSITGLEFSYSQAPTSMKSVLQAAWLLTVAFGNLIVVIVAESRLFKHQSSEFFMFSALMVADMMIFAIMAYRYKYVTPRSAVEEEKSKESTLPTKQNGVYHNEGFEEDTKM